jgi:hypothetical protein
LGAEHQAAGLAQAHLGDVAVGDFDDRAKAFGGCQRQQRRTALHRRAELLRQIAAEHDAGDRRLQLGTRQALVEQGDLGIEFLHACARGGQAGAVAALHRVADGGVFAGAFGSQALELQARATTIEIRRFQALFNDPALAHRLAEEGQALATQIAHVEQRLRELTVTAGIDGTLVLPRLEERFGHHYAQGAELGVVLPGGAPLIKLALGQTEAARVQAGHRSIEVRLVSDPHRPWPARLLRQTHEATRTLPSAALGSAAGGPIATASTDQSGRTSAEPVLLFDLELDAAATPAAALGQRAWVRFEHPPEPLAAQLAHHLRQVFLRSLGARE